MPIKVRGGSLRRVAIVLEDAISKSIGKLAVDITEELRAGTPKDTTHASQEWIPNLNSAHIGEVGSKQNPKVDISSNIERIKNFSIKNGDTSIHITNNTPYIQKLNAGYSKQAPTGFIETKIDRCVAKYNNQGDIITASA